MAITHNKIIKYLLALLSIGSYLIFILINQGNEVDEGYYITFIMPIVFFTCFYFVLWPIIFRYKTPFITLFSIVAFIRYVVLSIITIHEGGYNGLSGLPPSSYSLNFAGILMVWELIVTTFCIKIWSNKLSNNNCGKEIKTEANQLVYIIFILTTIALIIVVPQSRQGLSFFGSINRAMNEEVGSLLVLGIRECFINAKYFLLFFTIRTLFDKNNEKANHNMLFKYILIIIIGIIIIGLRIGTNRKKMIADALTIMLIVWSLFPKYKKVTTIFMVGVAMSLVAITTVFRGMTDSVGSFFGGYFNLEFLQPYFLGQYNVAIAIESLDIYGNMIDIKTYILSFLRPLFGIGSLVKNIDFTMAANIFDLRMSIGINGFRGDQIIPMIGEGYILFGAIMSPILSMITVKIGMIFDSLYLKSEKLEMVFISAIVSFYLAQGMVLNSTIILNMLSFRLVIYLPIVYLGYLLSKAKGLNNLSRGEKSNV